MPESEPTRSTEVSRVLRLAWGLEGQRRRGPKPGLTIDTIAAAAVEIADAEGLTAVSMSRVAAKLGFTTMSLYRYVDAKDDLVLVMVDHAYGRPGLPTRKRTGWRTRLSQWAEANRQVVLRHPWLLQVTVNEPPLGPNQVAWMEEGLDALAGTALTEQQKLSSMLLVDVYVRGQTQLATGIAASSAKSPPATDLYGHRLAQLIDEERFPRIWAALASGSLEDDDTEFSDDEFRFGLDTVLDGIEALVNRRTKSRPARRRT